MIDLSCNWFGTEALYEVRTEFTKFKALKTLKLATNKLCFGPPTDLMLANKLKEVLMNLNFLEELDLSENSMNDSKFEVLIPALVEIKGLKKLNISKNSITYTSFKPFIT
jgi:Ran GTPase-activating protein (RanGAP) involved in mRNA processing and transport